MENRGYIIETQCQDDKRLLCLNLTEEGEKHAQETNVQKIPEDTRRYQKIPEDTRRYQKIPEDFFKGLDKTEMMQMDNLLTKLINGWEKV